MGQQYLMDTNVLIDYLGKKISAPGMNFMNDVIDSTPKISIITKIEVLGFNASYEYLKLLSDFVDDAQVFDLTNSIVETTIKIRRSYKIKLPDAIIAATSIVHNLTLISRNQSDFKNIKGLALVDAHNL